MIEMHQSISNGQRRSAMQPPGEIIIFGAYICLLRAEDRLLLETSKVDSLTHIVVDTSFYFHDHSCGASYIIQRPKVVRKCPFIKRLPCLIFVLTSHYLRKERSNYVQERKNTLEGRVKTLQFQNFYLYPPNDLRSKFMYWCDLDQFATRIEFELHSFVLF